MNRVHVTAVLVSVAIGLLSFYVVDFYMMCGRGIINDVCKLYEQQEVTGSLCQDICNTRKIITTKCISTTPEKQVYTAKWEDKEIILKIVYTPEENQFVFEDSNNGKDFIDLINSHVKMLFGECENCSKLSAKFIDIADINNDGQLSFIEARTMIQLLRTPGPAMLLILNGSEVSLDIYGYCGPIYAVEKLAVVADTVYGFQWNFADMAVLPNIFEPIEIMVKQIVETAYTSLLTFRIFSDHVEPMLDNFKTFVSKYIHRVRVPSVRERFAFVRSHLNAIFNLSDNSYGLVQACDIHLGNFGLTHDNRFKVLDYDMVFPQHYLQNLLLSKQCKQDEDCRVGNFLECTSICNTGYCSETLKSQLIQNVCSSSIPLVFNQVHKDFQHKNQTILKCLENAVKDIALYCLKIPLANNTEQLHLQVEDIKEKFLNASLGRFKCSFKDS